MAINMAWLREFISSESTPRWQLVLGGVIVLVLGFAQNELYYNRSVADAESVALQQRLEAKVLEIQRHSIDFQTYAGAFVSSVLDDTEEVRVRRTALIGNILAQDAAIDVSANLVGDVVAPQVSEYREALRKMKVAVEGTTDVISMGQFWAAASDLLVARNKLLKALEEHARNTRV